MGAVPNVMDSLKVFVESRDGSRQEVSMNVTEITVDMSSDNMSTYNVKGVVENVVMVPREEFRPNCIVRVRSGSSYKHAILGFLYQINDFRISEKRNGWGRIYNYDGMCNANGLIGGWVELSNCTRIAG